MKLLTSLFFMVGWHLKHIQEIPVIFSFSLFKKKHAHFAVLTCDMLGYYAACIILYI